MEILIKRNYIRNKIKDDYIEIKNMTELFNLINATYSTDYFTESDYYIIYNDNKEKSKCIDVRIIKSDYSKERLLFKCVNSDIDEIIDFVEKRRRKDTLKYMKNLIEMKNVENIIVQYTSGNFSGIRYIDNNKMTKMKNYICYYLSEKKLNVQEEYMLINDIQNIFNEKNRVYSKEK